MLELAQKYPQTGPRYTSYPTADRFSPTFTGADYLEALKHTNEVPIPNNLSLYCHIPFCNTLCYYCACNKVHTKNEKKISNYLEKLFTEIALQGELVAKDRVVHQMHWGGGTPTLLTEEQSQALMKVLSQYFTLSTGSARDFSIEADPRGITQDKLTTLRKIGFNRLSFGVQDFDPQVQKAINRVQSEALMIEVFDWARKLGFKSVNIDLVYGLPFQTTQSFANTLEKLISLKPDRVAIYHYTHLPKLFPAQRKIETERIPTEIERLELLLQATCRLKEAGYLFLGLDHFVLPTDPLAIAMEKHTLQRNFQGYSTHAELDLIGLGVSAISNLQGVAYTQNHKTLTRYYECLDQKILPAFRGFLLSEDDLIRKAVIQSLMCHLQVHFPVIEHHYGILFSQYFAAAIQNLAGFEQDGLLKLTHKSIHVTPKGQFFLRNICRAFDAYSTVPLKLSR